MVEALEAHPKIKVLNWWMGEPVSEAEIKETETELGTSLDPSLLAFFRECNGFQIRWIHEEAPYGDDFEEEEPKNKQVPDELFIEDDDCMTGAINLVPLKRAFWQSLDYIPEEGSHSYNGKSYPIADFYGSISPFDRFSNYYDGAFITIENKSNPPVVEGSDYQADYTSKRVVDFATYIEFLLTNKGFHLDRMFNWDEKPWKTLDLDSLTYDDDEWEYEFV